MVGTERLLSWGIYALIAMVAIGAILSIVANEHYRFRTGSDYNPWRDIFKYNKTEKYIAFTGVILILSLLLFGGWLSRIDKQENQNDHDQLTRKMESKE